MERGVEGWVKEVMGGEGSGGVGEGGDGWRGEWRGMGWRKVWGVVFRLRAVPSVAATMFEALVCVERQSGQGTR